MAIAEFAFNDRAALAAAVSARIAALLEEAIDRNGSASLVVPGGSTPVAVFQDLAMRDLDWANVNVLPCDERWVAVDHADSNEGLIRRHLLTGKAGDARVLALYRPVATPADALPDVTQHAYVELLLVSERGVETRPVETGSGAQFVERSSSETLREKDLAHALQYLAGNESARTPAWTRLPLYFCTVSHNYP